MAHPYWSHLAVSLVHPKGPHFASLPVIHPYGPHSPSIGEIGAIEGKEGRTLGCPISPHPLGPQPIPWPFSFTLWQPLGPHEVNCGAERTLLTIDTRTNPMMRQKFFILRCFACSLLDRNYWSLFRYACGFYIYHQWRNQIFTLVMKDAFEQDRTRIHIRNKNKEINIVAYVRSRW